MFVERDGRSAAAIRDNLRAARLDGRGQVRRANAVTEVASLGAAGERFDVIVLDPPYGQELLERTLRAIAASGALAPDGIAVAEGHWRDDPGEIDGLHRSRTARYGETAVWYYEMAGPAE